MKTKKKTNKSVKIVRLKDNQPAKKQKITSRSVRKTRYLFILAAIAGVVVAYLLLHSSLKTVQEGRTPAINTHPLPTDTPVANSQTNDLALPVSLDIRQELKHTYTSSGLKLDKDLGTAGNIKNALYTFNVGSLKEYAYVTQPSTVAPVQGYPVIILCHGYVNPSRYNTVGNAYLPDMNFYTQHGYVVIRPDFRGNGRSQGKAEGAYYSAGYTNDLMTLVASVKSTPNLDKNNINLWGHSMGGFLVLKASVMSPDIKHTIILSGAVGTVYDMYTGYYAPSDRLNPTAQEIRSNALRDNGTPLTNPIFWYYTSPYSQLDKTQSYFQIYVGTNDKVVPPRFANELDQALTAEKKQHNLTVFPEGDHGLVNQRDQIWDSSLKILQS